MGEGGGGVDWQTAFNVVAGLLGALGAFVLKGFRDELRRTQGDLSALIEKLPETYARRDDLKELGVDLKATLARIEEKLDRKVDK